MLLGRGPDRAGWRATSIRRTARGSDLGQIWNRTTPGARRLILTRRRHGSNGHGSRPAESPLLANAVPISFTPWTKAEAVGWAIVRDQDDAGVGPTLKGPMHLLSSLGMTASSPLPEPSTHLQAAGTWRRRRRRAHRPPKSLAHSLARAASLYRCGIDLRQGGIASLQTASLAGPRQYAARARQAGLWS